MSVEAKAAESGLDALEAKVGRAVELIRSLRAERQGSLKSIADLTTRLGAAQSALSREDVESLKSRIVQLEKERGEWLDEKRSILRRVEEILAKLEYLESESAPR